MTIPNDSTMRSEKRDNPRTDTQPAAKSYWRVSVTPQEEMTYAPYMDQPRIFEGSEAECKEQFREYYVIRGTIHNIVAARATAEDYREQCKTDERKARVAVPISQGVPQQAMTGAGV